jgi:hypothetical protein
MFVMVALKLLDGVWSVFLLVVRRTMQTDLGEGCL